MAAIIHSNDPGVYLASMEIGGQRVYTTDWSISWHNNDFTRISLQGVVLRDNAPQADNSTMLRRFSILDLMAEVGRRIKTGENKTEAESCLTPPA